MDKVLLEYNQTKIFRYFLWLSSHYNERVVGTHSIATIESKTLSLAIYRRTLLMPNLH